jgi:hypothetical protein
VTSPIPPFAMIIERRVAERKGFEPLEAFRLQRFSRPPP